MRIVCVGYLHGSGGAERQIINLANALTDYGHEVYLLVLAENNRKFYISDKVNVVDLSGYEKEKSMTIFHRFIAYKREICRIKPDVSIHFWVQSVYFSYLISEKNKGIVIYSERGDPGDSEYDGLLGIIRDISFTKVKYFVFQSKAAKRYFSKKIQKRSIVIPNSIDISDCMEKEMEDKGCLEKKIINVGRLHSQKNQELLIRSFSQIADRVPNYKLDIYGEGELEDSLKKTIHRLHLDERVNIFPPTSNIHEKIMESSIFVLSSDFEGMPNVLLEAMAMGKICISRDYKPGGVDEIIKDGINGFIVRSNRKGELAKRMLYVINNIEKLDGVSNNAKRLKEKLSFEKIYRKWNVTITELFHKND